MAPSSLGGRSGLVESSLSPMTVSLAGVVGMAASIVILDRSKSGKVDSTCLRQFSNPVS